MGMHLLKGHGNYGASRREYKLSQISGNSWGKLVASPCQTFPSEWVFFQDDNAPVHRSRSTQEYMFRNHINCLSWPAQSPDLNVIEIMWLFIKRKLQSCSWAVKSKADLIEEIRLIWTGITPAYIHSMFGSIPKIIQQVILLKGTSQSIKL